MCERCGRQAPGYCGCNSNENLTKGELISELEDRIKELKEGE